MNMGFVNLELWEHGLWKATDVGKHDCGNTDFGNLELWEYGLWKPRVVGIWTLET